MTIVFLNCDDHRFQVSLLITIDTCLVIFEDIVHFALKAKMTDFDQILEMLPSRLPIMHICSLIKI